MMTTEQTKLIGLTMKLNLKAREYNKLCDELEKFKKSNIDPNDESLVELKIKFQQNYDEIFQINREISKIKEDNERLEMKQFDLSTRFPKKEIPKIEQNEKQEGLIVKKDKNILVKIFEKIKKILKITEKI